MLQIAYLHTPTITSDQFDNIVCHQGIKMYVHVLTEYESWVA